VKFCLEQYHHLVGRLQHPTVPLPFHNSEQQLTDEHKCKVINLPSQHGRSLMSSSSSTQIHKAWGKKLKTTSAFLSSYSSLAFHDPIC